MRILIAGGSGFIGQALSQYFINNGHNLIIIGRDKKKLKTIFNEKATLLDWQSLEGNLEKFENINTIINLSGENIASGLWTTARKIRLFDSRINTTQSLVRICQQLNLKPQCFICASGVNIYPPGPNIYNEEWCIQENEITTFMGKLAYAWEKATVPVKELGIRVISLRLSPVLATSGGILRQMLLLYKLGLGGRLGKGTQPFLWIALPDVIQAIDFVMQHPDLSGPINLVAPQIIDQTNFSKTLARAVKRPCWTATPAWLLKLFLGQMADELLLNGVKATPKKLFDAGFEFSYPTIEAALGKALNLFLVPLSDKPCG